MSETPETAAPVADAPVAAAPAAATPVASAAPAAVSDVAASSSEPAPVAQEAASESSPEVTHETFKWDGWEGATDSFPETIKPWAERISSYHQTKNATLEKNHRNLKELYDAVLSGGEDPRIKEFAESKAGWDTERAALTAKHAELQQGWDATKNEYASYEQAVYKYHVEKAGEHLEEFVNARPEILKDEAKYELFSGLLDERWDLPSADKLLKMSPEAVALARKAKSEGVPAHYAIQIAENQAPPQVQKPQPRPAATITSGAVNRTTPHASSRGMGDAKSLEESRAMASARALKLHKR